MAFWTRKRPKRRVERVRPETDVPWYRRLKSGLAIRQLAIVAGFVVAAALIVQLPRRPLPYRLGQTIKNPIRSRVTFDYVDREATAFARHIMAVRVPGVYDSDVRKLVTARQKLLDLVRDVAGAASIDQLPEPALKDWAIDPAKKTEADLALFAAVKKAVGTGGDELEAVKQTVRDALQPLLDPLGLPIMGQEDYNREVARVSETQELIAEFPKETPRAVVLAASKPVDHIVVAPGDLELSLDRVLVRPIEIQARIARTLSPSLERIFSRVGLEKLADLLVPQIGLTLKYNEALTENRRLAASEGVPPVQVELAQGSTIVPPGEVSEKDLQLLAREDQVYWQQLGVTRKILLWAGLLVAVGAILLIASIYTWRYQPGVARSVPRALILAILCLLVLGGVKALAQAYVPPAAYVLFLATAAMTVTIAYSQTFALAVMVVLVALVSLATPAGFDWALVALGGTAIAVLSLGEVNNRSKLIKVGFLSGCVMLAAASGLALWRIDYTMETLTSSLVYWVCGVGSGFLMLGLLPFIERAFGIVTNISLLELCDVNQPALKRLAIEAPGTYQHSLLIGTLGEASAEAIGANGLLARVGAYFHDIGKVNKPRYYVENWQEEGETHEGLTPQMSRLVITSHVKDGLEMADRLGLPPVIKRFIVEHHGTTLVEYFYREAERQHAANGGEQPSEADYRYPGPKPRSPETAIVMLADAVEGATRSLKDPTPAKIKAMVHEMVMKRLLDGQLDSSGLTLSDLHKIEETLTKTLLSVYHGRVPYPSDKASAETEPSGREKAGPKAPPPSEQDAEPRRGEPDTGRTERE